MRNSRFTKIIAKAVGFALMVGVLVGVTVFSAPTSVVQAADVKSLTAVPQGLYTWGAPDVEDPVAQIVDGHTNYQPSSYIYFGVIYNSATDSYEPMLGRVLDNDADNAGNPGAIFMLSENALYGGSFTICGQYAPALNFDNVYYLSSTGIGLLNPVFGSESRSDSLLRYLVGVTKTDRQEAMDGLYGYGIAEDVNYYWVTNELDKSGGESMFYWEAVVSDEAQYLNDSKYFLLSAEELAKYVGDYNGAEALKATNVLGDPVSWWTRTGIEDITHMGWWISGDHVGAVDKDGNVIVAKATDESIYTRIGYNIDRSQIVFSHRVGSKYGADTYKVAYEYPFYGNSGAFEAEAYKTSEGYVTLEYRNAHNFMGQSSENYITVVIEDENGNIKYYENVVKLEGQVSGSVNFYLPSDYNEDTDTIKVFWEQKCYGELGVGYVSNIVEIDCIHNSYTGNGSKPTCTKRPVCGICGEEYSKRNADAHSYEPTKGVNENGEYQHWNECAECHARADISDCFFGDQGCIARCTQCGNLRLDTDYCKHDDNGICTELPKEHFETPNFYYIGEGITVDIKNEGQWLYLARAVNSGEVIYDSRGVEIFDPSLSLTVRISADLDFSDVEYFVPMGTAENYMSGDIVSYNSDITVSNIKYKSDGSNVGLIGYAKDLSITGITMTNCTFEGASNVGALVGYGENVSIGDTRVINNVVVSADDGTQGAFIGTVAEATDSSVCSIHTASVAINVTDGENNHPAFASNDSELTVSDSYCLYEEDGENGRTSAETFASGSVAYNLQKFNWGWSQIIDKKDEDNEAETPDPLPLYYRKDESGRREEKAVMVYKVSFCNDTPAKYTNSTKNDYTVHKPEEVLDWIWDDTYCNALIKCGLCGMEDTTAAVVTPYYYTSRKGVGHVKTDYTATVLDFYGNTVTDSEGNAISDMITIISVHIEDVIGMTYIDKVYDFEVTYPDNMMENTRLYDDVPGLKEYEAFFVNPETGKKYTDTTWGYVSAGIYGEVEYAIGINDVGTYDLLVEGRGAYEGQSYTYKGALIIRPAVVEIAPKDVYKYYDGTASFESYYDVIADETVGEYIAYLFGLNCEVSYADAPSAAEGVYQVAVSLKTLDRNVQYVLTRDTVQAVIVPQLYVKIENKNYPTDLTYGDTVPTPTVDNFTVTAGSNVTFEWYRATSMIPIDAPNGVGDYVLRAKAGGVGNLAASYCDVAVHIEKKEIGYKIIVPEGIPTSEYSGHTFYVLDSLDRLEVEITGLINGDTLESYPRLMDFDSGIPEMPDRVNYYLTYSFEGGNYTVAGSDGIYVSLKPVGYPSPAPGDHIYDANNKKIKLSLSWEKPDVSVTGYGCYLLYTITVTEPSGNKFQHQLGSHDSIERNIYEFDVEYAGTYHVEIHAELEDFFDLSDDEYNEVIASYDFTVGIVNNDSEADDKSASVIKDIGSYTVTVTSNPGKADETVKTSDVSVRREVVMNIKECEINIGEEVVFDKTKVIMEAGKVILLTHELEEITCGYDQGAGTVYIESYKITDKLTGKDVSHLYSITSLSYINHQNGGLGVAHIFDSECDRDCNVDRCTYTRNAGHVGGTATCTELAICERCHMIYGDYDTDNHVSDTTYCAPNGDDLETHLIIHNCCGRTEKVVPHTEARAATCLTYALCADCGWEYGKLDPDNHASDENTYEYIDESGHKLTHNCCSAVETAPHTGGEATCTDLAKCEYCTHTYGEYDPDNHSGHIDYIPDGNDANLHLEEYNCCRRSALVAHSGGTETCIARAVCVLCKAEYGEIDPNNHASDKIVYNVREDNFSMHDSYRECCNEYLGKAYHTGGENTCISVAVCEYCSEEYGLGTNSDNHASDTIIYVVDPENPNNCVEARECCGVIISEGAPHTGGTASCEQGALCERCGYEYTERAAHTYADECTAVCAVCGKQTRSLSFHVDSNNDEVCDKCNAELEREPISDVAVSAIVTASVVVAGGSATAAGTGVFSLVWFVFEKKKLADLLRILFKI